MAKRRALNLYLLPATVVGLQRLARARGFESPSRYVESLIASERQKWLEEFRAERSVCDDKAGTGHAR